VGVGKEVKCVVDEQAFPHTALDPALRRELGGPCKVPWREGIRRMIGSRYPDIELAEPS
jgi:hypothetical protein